MMDLGVRLDDRTGSIDAEDGEVERHADDDDEVALLGDGARLWRVTRWRDLSAGIQDEPDCGRGPDRGIRQVAIDLRVARGGRRGKRSSRLGQERLRLGPPQETGDRDDEDHGE